ncbi:MAG: HlyC/CorC family transporter [Clostridia bacterium]|nr:HlyC/CorC family transporter [Clostridia bacterium]
MTSQIFVLIVLIALNAFFAATEIAFISLNDVKIELKAKEGNKKAKKIQKMLKDPSKFLATIQIGITLAGFLSSAFASETFADVLAPKLYNLMPMIALAQWKDISIIIITLILSYFTLVFGELVPKRIAMKYSEKLAFMAVGVIRGISIFTLPFVKLLTFSTNIISRLFGVTGEEEENVSEEEIKMMVDVGEEKGTIETGEKEMINNIFEFNDRVVSEIMIPRTQVYALDMELTINEAIDMLNEDTRYSRIPIYDENIDNIRGIVYVKDMLLTQKSKNTKLKNIARNATYVLESIYIDDVFKELKKNKKQIAIVVDEYGGTAGIVTMEDILEEIVGEIYDEYDIEESKYKKIDNNTFLLEGEVPIYEVEKLLGIDLPEGDYDTISGYLLFELNRIPSDKEKGIIIETDRVTYKIEKIKNNRIMKVKACKNLKD